MPEILNVQEVLNYLDLKDTMSAVEFGCGAADFSLALAKKLDKGKVYALDIQEEKLSAIKGKAALQKVSNITTILCDLESYQGSTLVDDSQDIVLIPNVLFQAENKHGIILEGIRILKSGGQLLILDWLANAPFGPKENLALPNQMKKIAGEFDLQLKKEFAAGDYHYGLLFIK